MLDKVFKMFSWKVDEAAVQAVVVPPPIALYEVSHNSHLMWMVPFVLIFIVLSLALAGLMLYVAIFDSNNELFEEYFTWEAVKKMWKKVSSFIRMGFARMWRNN